MGLKRKKYIKKAPKNIKIQEKQQKIQRIDKNPAGRKQCPLCHHFQYIRSFKCTQCNFDFPQKLSIVSKQSVFKKSSQKSILTILQHNIFNTVNPQYNNIIYAQFKPKTTPLTRVITQEKLVKINKQQYQIKYQKISNPTQKFKLFCVKNPIKCVVASQYGLIFTEEVSIQPQGISKNDMFTIQAYGLKHFHKMGHEYHGISNLYISLTFLEKGYYKCQLKKNIIQMDVKFNILCILSGEGSLYFYTLPSKAQVGQQQLNLVQTSSILLNNVTVFCWLNTSFLGVIIGDQLGNIKIYTANNKFVFTLTRAYFHSHHNHITSIKCCPINIDSEIIFASSGYDGYVKIWSYNQLNHIFQIDVTSKKINDIIWDHGGKFILTSKDDTADGCSILTFFSTNKTDKKQVLVSQCEHRYLKQYNNYEYLSSSLGSDLCVFASTYGGVQLCDMEYLRKFSIKKKSHNINKFPFSGFNIIKNENVIEIIQQKMKIQQNTVNIYEHIISSASLVRRGNKQKIIVGTYLGLLVILQKKYET